MTGNDDVYAAVIRQAPHDAVRVLLTAPPDSITGSQALREVTTWLAAEHGAAAVIDLAEELAADLAEAFEVVAAAEGRPALAVLDSWYYRLQGPRLLVEWDNTQSEANHAHSVWRDPTADFGLDVLAAHRAAHH